ncbi:unnamed protein product [Hyaloperonospora brassicae]|uniref:KIF-binding protein n=1 Tax=Hyaloperonospora brassicae TaxID=162125 RepID=A0AAV0V0C4_HYABA|nr:unnamed protein product [Hyaloperonospora brassicae]
MTRSIALREELQTDDVQQLWALACLLAQRKLVVQTAQCLEPLCALDCSARSAEEQAILVQANSMYAEICSAACSRSKKAADRELWTRRIVQIEKCIDSVDSAVARGVPCSHESQLRLLKAKFILQRQLKAERYTKNQKILEILTEGLQVAARFDDSVAVGFRKYFEVKMKACLVKMHAATVTEKCGKGRDDVNRFAENLRYLRTALPSSINKSFLLWLVEATRHTAISSFIPGDVAETRQLVDFGQEFLDRVSVHEPVSTDFRLHHLVITGFYYLRTGALTKLTPLLKEAYTWANGAENDDSQERTGSTKHPFLKTILDSLRVSVVASSDPKEACDLAMKTALSAQENLQASSTQPAVRLVLIATLFDMLYVYCRLLAVQCRYADMGTSIVQTTTLFTTYKVDLERSILYRVVLARCHTLIAKFATAIGKVKNACAHLNFVVDKVLPAPAVGNASYPDAYLAAWVDVLEVATHCCKVDTLKCLTSSSGACKGARIEQIYPSRVLLQWAARVLTLDGLQYQMRQCCNVELRARHDLALAKWMWATKSSSNDIEADESNVGRTARDSLHTKLETLRPGTFTLLHDALHRVNTSVTCCETTSEIMALFGPQLAARGEVEQAENMLENAICIALHAKNVLLQTRLLADVFELYASKGLTKAQAAAAAKYEKKLATLQRRVAAAQANEATLVALLRWTVDGST